MEIDFGNFDDSNTGKKQETLPQIEQSLDKLQKREEVLKS